MRTETLFSIRPAVDSDAPAILFCLAEAFLPYRTVYSQEAFLDTVLSEQIIKQRMKSMNVLVAEQPACDEVRIPQVIETVAWSLVSEKEGHLRGMAVLAPWQGGGVAKALLDRAEAELRALGCSRLTLDTTEPLQRAIRFYQRNGFGPSGRVADFYGMPLFEYVKTLR